MLTKYKKQHLFVKTFNMPDKTMASWNKYPLDNYRLFAITILENITFIYSFKTNLEKHSLNKLSKKNDRDIFIVKFIDTYLLILQKHNLKIFNNYLSENDKTLVLKSIKDIFTDKLVLELNIWKYYNGTVCRRSMNKRKEYMISLMFVLLILINE